MWVSSMRATCHPPSPNKPILFALLFCALGGLVAGCGGSGASSPSVQNGTVSLSLDWPEPLRSLPRATEKVEVKVTGLGGEVLSATTVSKPANAPATTKTEISVPSGSECNLIAEAVTSNGTILGSRKLGPLKFSAGSALNWELTLDPSVKNIEVTPGVAMLGPRERKTVSLKATGSNPAKEILVPVDLFVWESSNPAVASVQVNEDGTAQIEGLSDGKANITVRDPESGVTSNSVVVTVEASAEIEVITGIQGTIVDMSGDGSVLVGTGVNDRGNIRPFHWESFRGQEFLIDSSPNRIFALAVSSNGRTVVTREDASVQSRSGTVCLWVDRGPGSLFPYDKPFFDVSGNGLVALNANEFSDGTLWNRSETGVWGQLPTIYRFRPRVVSNDGLSLAGTREFSDIGGTARQLVVWSPASTEIMVPHSTASLVTPIGVGNGASSVVANRSDWRTVTEVSGEKTNRLMMSAFCWLPGKEAKTLLEPEGYTPDERSRVQTVAIKMSDDGTKAVGTIFLPDGSKKAFIADLAGGVRILHGIPASDYQSEAVTVNQDGTQVIGYCPYPGGGGTYVRWRL